MSRAILACCLGLIIGVPARAADDEQKAAQEIIDRAVKAMGGAEPVARMKNATWKAKAKVTINEVEATTIEEWSVKNVDKYRIDVTLTFNGNTINGTVVINNGKGWAKANDKSNELPKGQPAGFQRIFRSGRLIQVLPSVKEKPYTPSPLGELKVGDQETVGVRISEKDQPDVSLYFDKKTGLPVKAEVRVTEMADGAEIGYEILFADYKDFDGIKHPTKITVHRDGKQAIETEISDVKPQDLDDSLFDKP